MELLNCPFCDGPPISKYINATLWIECAPCNLAFHSLRRTPPGLIEWWNKRAAPRMQTNGVYVKADGTINHLTIGEWDENRRSACEPKSVNPAESTGC